MRTRKFGMCALFAAVSLYSLTCAEGQLRFLNNVLINNSVLRSINTYAGESFSTFARLASEGPLALARVLGFTGSIPSIVNRRNINTDVIAADFNAGLSNEDAQLNFKQLANKYGYEMEDHTVVTCDGYILTLHRIPCNGTVIFLMHGLLGSSDDYLIAGPESGLAYLLSRAGYDVWLGNARGNKHSRKHKILTTSNPDFWDFSWHEIGLYDLPALIDYTLNYTGESRLKYIGHSQGSTAFFVMASEKPEYNDKVGFMTALSPVAWMSSVRSPLVRLLSPGGPLIHVLTKAIGIHEFFPDTGLLRMLKTITCSLVPLAEVICSNVLFLSVGFDFEQLNVTNLGVIFGHVPAGASVKQFAHYGQGVVNGDFRHFDYGTRENMKIYSSKTPPSYKVELITTRISLFYSDADWLAQPDDVETLYKKLSNVVDMYKVPYKRFNHVDYIWAKDAKTIIFDRLIRLLKIY